MTTAEKTLPRLKQRYREEIREQLQEQFKYGNVCLLYTSPSPRD